MSAGRDPRADEEACAALLEADLAHEQPRPGWQQQVWARIERRRVRRRWLWTVVPLAVAVAVIVLVALPRSVVSPDRPSFTLASARPAEASRLRGELAAGDTVIIEGRALASAAVVELRIYRGDGSLLLACQREAPCERAADRLVARVTIAEAGRYRVLVVEERAPTAARAGRYDEDTAALLDSGGSLLFSRLIELR